MIFNFREWVANREERVISEMAAQFIDSGEYASRLRQLGWRVDQNGSHFTAFAPDGTGMVTWSSNNWNKNWHQISRDLLRFAKGGRGAGGYEDLDFVFQNPFVTPPNFDTATQSVIKSKTPSATQVWIQKAMSNPAMIQGKEVSTDNGVTWHTATEVDYRQDGQGLDIMFDDGEVKSLGIKQQIMVR